MLNLGLFKNVWKHLKLSVCWLPQYCQIFEDLCQCNNQGTQVKLKKPWKSLQLKSSQSPEIAWTRLKVRYPSANLSSNSLFHLICHSLPSGEFRATPNAAEGLLWSRVCSQTGPWGQSWSTLVPWLGSAAPSWLTRAAVATLCTPREQKEVASSFFSSVLVH